MNFPVYFNNRGTTSILCDVDTVCLHTVQLQESIGETIIPKILGETHLCSSTFLNTIAGLLLMAFMKMNVSKKKFPKIFQEDYYYCWANKWTGFYMIGISAMKELNIPLLFYLRSGRLEVFFRNFAKFTGTHLCQSLLLNKVALFLMKHLQWLLLK